MFRSRSYSGAHSTNRVGGRLMNLDTRTRAFKKDEGPARSVKQARPLITGDRFGGGEGSPGGSSKSGKPRKRSTVPHRDAQGLGPAPDRGIVTQR